MPNRRYVNCEIDWKVKTERTIGRIESLVYYLFNYAAECEKTSITGEVKKLHRALRKYQYNMLAVNEIFRANEWDRSNNN